MILRDTLLLLPLCLGCLAGGPAVQAAELIAQSPGTVLLSGRLLQPNGTLQDQATVVVRAGQITRVSGTAEREGEPVHRLPPGSVIAPGLIDLFALPSVVSQTMEDARAIDLDADPAWALDPTHRDFRAALEAGITTVMVAPSATNLVSGVCVTVRTYAPRGQLDTVRDEGPLLLGFGEGVWRADRKPTSRAGAAYQLRKLLAQAPRTSLIHGSMPRCVVNSIPGVLARRHRT